MFFLEFSTTDHIHAINQAVEKYAEYTKPLCMTFIKYENIFDSVETSTVIKTHRRQECGGVYVKILDEKYIESTANVKPHKAREKIPK